MVQTSRARKRPRARQRPFGVTIIALLLLANGLLAVGEGIQLTYDFYREHSGKIHEEEVEKLAEDLSLLDWLTLPVTIAGIVLAWGMWTLRSWAWTATIALQGVYLAAQLHDYIQGEPVYHNLLITVVTVFYLNTHDVQVVFRPQDVTPPENIPE
jgi:hypothetical protein